MCNKRPGRTIDNHSEHSADHKVWSRRDFLQSAGMFTAGMAATLNGLPVYALGTSALHAPLSNLESDRVLVLIQLRGGNDGLNTVIDRFNPTYYNIRPTLAVAESGLWALDAKYGMPNNMYMLRPMWEEGKMKIIHNVGYPDPNYSHFRSSDIWASASDAKEVVNSGWIGRYIDYEMPAFLDAQPTVPPALQIGVQTDLTFKGAKVNLALAVSSPQEFYKLALSGQLYDIQTLGNAPRDKSLFYVRQVANSAFRYSQSISTSYNKGRNEVAYPDSNLARQLAIVARLIKGGLGTKVYMVYIDGFDTHANQLNTHPLLLNRIATSVAAFYQDLAAQQADHRVLSMTFSEFGRTIHENGSAGTDHGTGAPMLLFCKDIGKEIIGSAPNLNNLDQYGDPYFEIDFRDVYATTMQHWFGMPPEVAGFIMGKDRSLLNGLVPVKNPPVGTEEFGAILGHKMSDSNPDIIQFHFATLQDGPAILELLDKSGQLLRILYQDFTSKGTHIVEIHAKNFHIRPGSYLYRLKTGGKIYQRHLLLW
ncbi:MAG: DUF1501 domain-containing protein [Saprospiraceae bacterium]|nr:DUF1501 domain-containing protein [Saprospiraceae bacterium]